MFPESLTSLDVRLLDHRRRLAAADTRARLATDRAGHQRPRRGTEFVRTLGSLISRLLVDSREPLRTKEFDLAAYGVRWSEATADQTLAAELATRTALRRDHSPSTVAPCPA